MSKCHISGATSLYAGPCIAPGNADASSQGMGVPLTPCAFYQYGAIAAALPTGIINAATGAELPDTETVTYAASSDGAAPLDAVSRPDATEITTSGASATVWDLGTPRNIAVSAAHATSIVAVTITVTGFDQYGVAMTEDLEVSATGTTKAVAGKKAFRYVSQVSVAAAADATANTISVGTGVVIGLPYRVATANACLPMEGGVDASAAVVAADDSAATAITGDVRGTVAFGNDPDGTREYGIWVMILDTSSRAAAYGSDQA